LPWNHLLKTSPTKVSTGLDSPRPPLPFPPCARPLPTPGTPTITGAGRAGRAVQPPPLPLLSLKWIGMAFSQYPPVPFPFYQNTPLYFPPSLFQIKP
jgi:hypothetical protein